LQLLPGSLVLLIGPNGIGKSVLLKTLCGLQPATEGSVHVNNTNIHIATAEIRASLTSILLATPPNIEQMTVYDMVVSGRQRFLPSRIQFLDLLKVLAKSESKIILYSSHDLQLSLNYCDHVLALTHKQWQFFADPQSVIIADIFPNP